MSLFALQKTAALLLMPAGLGWLALLAAAVHCFRRRQRGLGAFLLATFLLYGLAGNLHVGAALMARLERGIPHPDPATAGPFDAVCVLGGGTEEDPFGRPELGQAGDRVLLAARLWHLGRTPLLVTSGMGRTADWGVRSGGEDTRALWRDLGIPDRAILVVPESCWITRDEIAAYRRLQERHRWRRLGLVSSASHLPRALALARHAGLAVEPLGADWLGQSRVFQLQNLVPQADGFLGVQRACWEYLGRWVGR